MIKIMKFLLFIILTTTFFAAPLQRNIEDIAYRSHNGATICLIKLSDGSVWKWTPDAFSENFLRTWNNGDPILIEAVNQPGFILHNLAKPHYSPQVALTFSSYTVYPSLRSYTATDLFVELDDGSTWELLDTYNKRTLTQWAQGDRIIPVKGSHDSYQLINLDIPYENRSHIERHIEVFPY